MTQYLFALLLLVTTAYNPPRTKDGRPDLQGVWNFASGVPLQRSPKFADKRVFTQEEFEKQRAVLLNGLSAIVKLTPINAVGLDWIDNTLYVKDLRTSLITYPDNGRLPALVEGVIRRPGFEDILGALGDTSNGPPSISPALAAAFTGGARKNSHTDFSDGERCLESVPVPLLPQFADSYVQIVQSSGSLALVMDGERRVIAIENTPPAWGKVRTSTGTSKGHWEGDTLVVETRNFTARTPGLAAAGNSRDKVVTERFTRTAAGLEYAATIVDPSTFKDRIELSFPMARVDARIYEATCNEGNYWLANTLSAGRKEDEAKKEVQP